MNTITYDELLVSKILALFHDPPNKSLIITRAITGATKSEKHLLYKRFGRDLKAPLCEVYNKDRMSKHELEAMLILQELLYKTCLGDYVFTVTGKEYEGFSRLLERVKGADSIASSFDRWISDQLSTGRKGGSDIFRGVLLGLLNTFNPILLMYYTRARKKLSDIFDKYYNIYEDVLGNEIYDINYYVRKLIGIIRDVCQGTPCLNVILHVLENIVEPLWYEVYPRIVIPADTRSPTHSLFDHLYATAMTVNIVADVHRGRRGRKYKLSGWFVGLSVGGLHEWLSGSRKLSDLWVSSWLATAMVWYTVKELVWCLGGDILLSPGFRWNHFYYSLLKEKLSDKFNVLEKLLREYAFYEGFPYYAWIPASIIMVLPSNITVSGGKDILCYYDDECREIIHVLNSREDKGVEEYLRKRFNEAWSKVVDVVISVLTRKGVRIGEWLKNLRINGLLSEPPLELAVVVEKVGNGHSYLPLDTAKKLYAEKYNKVVVELDRSARKSLPVWARNNILLELTRGDVKLSECSLVDGGASRDIGKHRWRHCSVCGYAPAILHVPGMDLPNGEVSREYKEWAYKSLCIEDEDFERCWRKWRPVFRPGERLCPYCLIKRLASLPEFFSEIAEKLVGYRPPKNREIVFPSTSDVAALAVKIALLKAVIESLNKDSLERVLSEVTGKELLDATSLRGVIETLSVELERSRLHTDLKNLLDRVIVKDSYTDNDLNGILKGVEKLVHKRYWTPRLLRYHVHELFKLVKERHEEGRIKPLELLFVAAILLFVDAEIEEALLENSPRAHRVRELLRRIANALEKVFDREEWVKDVVEALTNPRIYYGLIAFDVDGLGSLRRGIITSPINKEYPLSVGKYLDMIRLSVYVSIGMANKRSMKRSSACTLNKQMILKIKDIEDPKSRYRDLVKWCGSLLVSPSYHYALANSVSYTLLRTAIVAERLGGIPVYMGGDEGLVIAPTWLPWSLVHRRSLGYRSEVVNTLQVGKDDDFEELDKFVSPNPSAIIALLVKRIMWSSSSATPGFHPVKKLATKKDKNESKMVTMWRIPAIVSAGLSIGLRFAHYRDPMREEIRVTEHLINMVKNSGGDGVAVSYGRPGYMLTHVVRAGYLKPIVPILGFNNEARLDRIREKTIVLYNSKISELKFTDVEPIRDKIRLLVKSTGSTLALALLLQGFVEYGVFSRSILYDLDKMWGSGVDLEAVENALKGMPVKHVISIIKRLFSRNTTRNKLNTERQLKLLELFKRELGNYEDAKEAFNLFKNMYYAALMLEKSMREVR